MFWFFARKSFKFDTLAQYGIVSLNPVLEKFKNSEKVQFFKLQLYNKIYV